MTTLAFIILGICIIGGAIGMDYYMERSVKDLYWDYPQYEKDQNWISFYFLLATVISPLIFLIMLR